MRRTLLGAVAGLALTIGTQGAAFAVLPASASTAIDTRQSIVVVDPSSTLPSDTDLSNQPGKAEPDADSNSSDSGD
jgi:hypothetical protein